MQVSSGARSRAAVPSGASTGEHEALELRDGDAHRYGGKGVLKAIANIHDKIAPEILGLDAADQVGIDRIMCELDGTPHKTNLGANAILAVSMAVARAAADTFGMPLYRYIGGVRARTLPVPMMNVVNGGRHADNNLDIQEFMIVPVGAVNFAEALRMGSEVFHALKKLLAKDGLSTAVGDEGGFAPKFKSSMHACDYLVRAITGAGYEPGEQVALALDCAASEFYENGRYVLQARVDEGAWIGRADRLLREADPGLPHRLDRGRSRRGRLGRLGRDDGQAGRARADRGRRHLRDEHGSPAPRDQGEERELDPDQAEPDRDADRDARGDRPGAARTDSRRVISHRSGETEDTFIADLAVATNAGMIKTGSLCRSERVAKYNQLLRIEEELGDEARYPGRRALNGAPAKMPAARTKASDKKAAAKKPAARVTKKADAKTPAARTAAKSKKK